MRYLLDSNILIDHLRCGDVWDKFVNYINKDSEIFIPMIWPNSKLNVVSIVILLIHGTAA